MVEIRMHNIEEIRSEKIYQLEGMKSFGTVACVKKMKIINKKGEVLTLTLFSDNREKMKIKSVK